jgi:rubrerythrin
MSAAVRPEDLGVARAGGVATLAELMTWALWLELDAAERYHDLAGAMETHNNDEVADLFRRMAAIEERHADGILKQMRWLAPPPLPSGPPPWVDHEGPESVSHDDVHYLMRPWHALALALKGEQRAARFFAALAAQAADPALRAAAQAMADEEREHVALVEAWMAKVPPPDERWHEDPDPPRYLD